MQPIIFTWQQQLPPEVAESTQSIVNICSKQVKKFQHGQNGASDHTDGVANTCIQTPEICLIKDLEGVNSRSEWIILHYNQN